MVDEKIRKLIESEVVAFSTVDENDCPNVVSVMYVKVVDKNKLLITDNFFNKKRINLLKNKNVALAVWDKNGEVGYQVKGEAEYLTSGEWKKKVDEMEENEGLAHKGAVVVTMKEIWNLASPGLVWRV